MMLAALTGALLLGTASVSLARNIPLDGALVEKRATSTTSSSSFSATAAKSSIVLEGVSTSRTATPKPTSIPASCANTPNNRGCWDSTFNISTNYYTSWPKTNQTVNYFLKVTNTTCNPDGAESRNCLLFNGTYPGPVLTANWGDTISVTVENDASVNGTDIHWHGVRQLNSNSQDGVGGVTECPLAPGKTKTYSFLATQYGSTWYHSHYSVQYGNGLVGPLIINGPATANYDEDLGSQILGDWWYKDAFLEATFQDQALNNASSVGAGPRSDNILVNGSNKNPAGTTGAYQRTTIASGKKYRLRLINTSIDAQLRVALDNHPFEVIAADFVPIVPFNTSSLLLAIGQRYDVIFIADQKPANYWFRAEFATDCASNSSGLGHSIFTYESVEAGTPTATTNRTLPTPGCNPEADIDPFVAINVDEDTFQSQMQELTVSVNTPGVKYLNSSIAAWGVNLSNVDVQWDRPTLDFIAANDSAYPEGYNVVQIPQQGVWTYWIVQEIPDNAPNSKSTISIPHPFHLHGHDFWVLGNSSNSNFSIQNDLASLNFNNPPRRDVTFLPKSGWVVLAFYSDNPGAWMMHCHIAWHVSEGLGMQFVESNSSIPAPDAAWKQTCQEWDDYYATAEFKQTDSGL